MSDHMLDELLRQQNEEDFFREAGKLIAEEEMEKLLDLQNAPEIPPDLAKQFHKESQELISGSFKKKSHHIVFRRATQVAAAVMIGIGISSTALYVTVDAARNSINNFFLEQFDDHAVVKPDDGNIGSNRTVPEGWNGPATPGWIPERYTNVVDSVSDGVYGLFYSGSQESDILLIHLASGKLELNIDTEDMLYCSEVSVQGVSGKIYSKFEENQYALFFVKNDISVLIRGNASVDEIVKVADQIIF